MLFAIVSLGYEMVVVFNGRMDGCILYLCVHACMKEIYRSTVHLYFILKYFVVGIVEDIRCI